MIHESDVKKQFAFRKDKQYEIAQKVFDEKLSVRDIEKLVKDGFVIRKKKQLISTEKGRNLIAVLPDNIKSPILTAEWESML